MITVYASSLLIVTLYLNLVCMVPGYSSLLAFVYPHPTCCLVVLDNNAHIFDLWLPWHILYANCTVFDSTSHL